MGEIGKESEELSNGGLLDDLNAGKTCRPGFVDGNNHSSAGDGEGCCGAVRCVRPELGRYQVFEYLSWEVGMVSWTYKRFRGTCPSYPTWKPVMASSKTWRSASESARGIILCTLNVYLSMNES